jgi:hypothetical protein
MLASVKQNAGDRFLLYANHPFDASDAITLQKHTENHQRLFVAQIHIAEKPFGLCLKVTLAVATEKPLIAFAVFSRFDGFKLAVVTGHLSLAFQWRLAQTDFAWNPA